MELRWQVNDTYQIGAVSEKTHSEQLEKCVERCKAEPELMFKKISLEIEKIGFEIEKTLGKSIDKTNLIE